MNNNFVKQTGVQNPLDGINVGGAAHPKLVDFDGDGDLDLFVGNFKRGGESTIIYLKNVGDKNNLQFIEQSGAANPFNSVVFTDSLSRPAFADLNEDGLIDTALVGNFAGTLSYFTYDGKKFSEQTGTDNPFDGIKVNSISTPAWADLNGDGKLDLVLGVRDGTVQFFLNDGTKFSEQTDTDNPFDGLNLGTSVTPIFQDIDGDGDLDGIWGATNDTSDTGTNASSYLENIGTEEVPEFVERTGTDNPFTGSSVNTTIFMPNLGDIDGDGDLDLLVGDFDGNINYFVNSPSVSITAGNVTPSEAGETPGFFEVKLSEPAPASGLTIQYQVENREISATEGVDYQPLSGIVKIAPGATTGKIEIIPIDDKDKDSIETVTVSLTGVPEGYVVDGENKTPYLAISDNEGNPNLAKILNEPNFKDQWYLNNTEDNRGTPGVDINVLKVWSDYSGKGIQVGVVDVPIEGTHPDLDANFNPTSYSGNLTSDAHGTAVAGIIAAEVGNGLGGVGVAFNSTLNSFSNFNKDKPDTQAPELLVPTLREQINVDISNNSWGADYYFGSDFRKSEDPNSQNTDRQANYAEIGEAIRNATANGRDGLGTIFVFSAGNQRYEGSNSNYSNLTNSRHTIAVGGLESDGTLYGESNPGASLLISAFSSYDIFTTDNVGKSGFTSGDYLDGFSGTSASAPMVSGVVALMLEANPELGYRDVQEILAYSAQWTDTSNESWEFNGANNWNGGGLHHSSDYGFGQVDALAAVRLAETWQTQHTAANEQKISVSSTAPIAIPDNELAGVNDTLTVEEGVNIDRVEIDLEINHERYENLIVNLTSPTGVVSELVNRPSVNETGEFGESNLYTYDSQEVDGQDFLYTFSTNFDWGETGVGDWTLNVVDAATGNTGMVNNWTLNLYGDTITKNDTYIYTNDFAKEGINDLASRQTLSDTNKGKDTINAAAVSSDLVLNLRPGKTSTIAGREVTIAEGTTIEKAFGGDGNDVIWGNKKNNILNGGRGNDQLWGRKGFNTLTGGDGNDAFVFNRVKKYTFDTITDFEIGKDVMDVSQIVAGINNSDFEFEDYFQFVSQGSGTEVQVNESGDDDGQFITIATLDNVNANELSSEQFIV